VLRIKFSGGRQFSSPKSPTSCSCKTLVANLDMKTVMTVLTLFLLTSCGLDCIKKKTGVHQASTTIDEAKEKGVFQFELQPNKLTFPLDSGRTFEIENAWVEYSWSYQCVDNKSVVTKDNFMQVVIESKTRPKTITHVDYAIMDKGGGVFLSSTNLDFDFKGQDTVRLQLVKFKDLLDSTKTNFDKIILTKKVSH
jgi:hypothetical protein